MMSSLVANVKRLHRTQGSLAVLLSGLWGGDPVKNKLIHNDCEHERIIQLLGL